MVGDSNTQGSNGAYRLYLQDKLTQNGIDFDFVGIQQTHTPSITPLGFIADPDHTSFGGWRIHEVHDKLKSSWGINPDTLGQPDIALVMLGTNDMIADVGVHGPPPFADSMAFENAQKNYENLLNDLFEYYPDLTVFVGNLLTSGKPLATDNKEQEKALKKIQKRIELFNHNFINKLGQNENINLHEGNLQIVDMFSIFQPSEMPSRFHPAEEDYERVAKMWFDAMSYESK